MSTKNAKKPLRIEQYETVAYNLNLNPLGVPASVSSAIKRNAENIMTYPDKYYDQLKGAIKNYAKCEKEHLVLGTGCSDLLRIYTSLISPKKAMLLTPCNKEYEKVLSVFNCEIDYYELKENENFNLNLMDFVPKLDSSYDVIIIGNPNNPTSQVIDREDMETLAEVCKTLEIFLIIDEMYMEFTENCDELTSIPLVQNYDNIAVIRSIAKFFACPGLRMAYSVMSNKAYLNTINLYSAPNSISTMSALGCIELFKDQKYIDESRSQVFTERNLIYSAMFPNKNLQLFKPYGNFMLVKILKKGVTAANVIEHCKLRGLILRNCEDIRGLDNKYFRFCFMNPKQNDLLVNTILELF